jgi:hypothetical protein
MRHSNHGKTKTQKKQAFGFFPSPDRDPLASRWHCYQLNIWAGFCFSSKNATSNSVGSNFLFKFFRRTVFHDTVKRWKVSAVSGRCVRRQISYKCTKQEELAKSCFRTTVITVFSNNFDHFVTVRRFFCICWNTSLKSGKNRKHEA